MFELLMSLGSRPLTDVKFLGERAPSEVISGSGLAGLVGLTAGTAQHDDSGWLHVLDANGQELMIAKRPFRHSLTWFDLMQLGLVYGGYIYQYGNFAFRVRLLTGSDTDPGTAPGGEWDDVLGWLLAGKGLATYTEADLGMGSGLLGRRTLTQTTSVSNATSVVYRGDTLFTSYSNIAKDTSSNLYGWRPVLELIDTSRLIWPVTKFIYTTGFIKKVRPIYWGYSD